MIIGHSPTLAASRRAAFSIESLESRSLLSGGHFHAADAHGGFSTFSTQTVSLDQKYPAPVDANSTPSSAPQPVQMDSGWTDAHFDNHHVLQPQTLQFTRSTFVPASSADSVQIILIQYASASAPIELPGLGTFAPPIGLHAPGRSDLPHIDHHASHEYPVFPIPIDAPSSGTTSSGNDVGVTTGAQQTRSGRSNPTLAVPSSSEPSKVQSVVSTVVNGTTAIVSKLSANARALEVLSGDAAKLVTTAASAFSPAALSTTTLKLSSLLSGTRLFDWTGSGNDSLPTATPAQSAAVASASDVSTPMKNVLKSFIPSRFYHITQLPSPLALLNDSLSSFVDDAASTSATVVKTVASEQAAVVTVAVIAADVAILTYFRRTRPSRKTAAVHSYSEAFATSD
jgi:hypothetical protein